MNLSNENVDFSKMINNENSLGNDIDFAAMTPDERHQAIDLIGKHQAFHDAAHPKHQEAVKLFAECHGVTPKQPNLPVSNEVKQLVESPAYSNVLHTDHQRTMQELRRLHNIPEITKGF